MQKRFFPVLLAALMREFIFHDGMILFCIRSTVRRMHAKDHGNVQDSGNHAHTTQLKLRGTRDAAETPRVLGDIVTFHIHVITIPTVLLECQDVWAVRWVQVFSFDSETVSSIVTTFSTRTQEQNKWQLCSMLPRFQVPLCFGSGPLCSSRQEVAKKKVYVIVVPPVSQLSRLLCESANRRLSLQDAKLGSKNPLSVPHHGVDHHCTVDCIRCESCSDFPAPSL